MKSSDYLDTNSDLEYCADIMFKLERFIDKNSYDKGFDLITYYTIPRYFIIQKLRYENKYDLWFNYCTDGPLLLKNLKLLGNFKTLKSANMYAYKWYIDNL